MTDHEFDSILDAYPVRLQNFEGPLDLLLHLIKKHELSIYDIPIALFNARASFFFTSTSPTRPSR